MSTHEATDLRKRPNVVLINCDDLGYGDLGCYGSQVNKTPAIDRLAADGLRCEDFYMASPVCSPSRAAMLTGSYPPRIGFGSFNGLPVLFPGHRFGLSPNEVTLARMLRDAGYRTHMIGKWHCGDQPGFLPTDHGFDHFFGLPFSHDMGRQDNTPSFMPPQNPLPLMIDAEVIEQQPDLASLTERYTTEAVRFLRSARSEPFFLYFAHMYVHLPLYVQERFAKQTENGPYGAAVETIDWSTDVLVNELRALGLEENTIVIFTSDNGSLGNNPSPWGGDGNPLGGSNGPLRGTKGSTWEGGQRVPCIVKWPARISKDRVTREVLSSMDLYPTLATCCEAVVPQDRTIDGHDVSDVWFDDATPSPHDALFFYWMNDLEAVRVGAWKLHLAKRGVEILELYNLVDDVAETTNLAQSRPDVVEALQVHVRRARSSLGDARLALVGADVRAVGIVDHPRPLTTFDPDYPYYMAEYDLSDRG